MPPPKPATRDPPRPHPLPPPRSGSRAHRGDLARTWKSERSWCTTSSTSIERPWPGHMLESSVYHPSLRPAAVVPGAAAEGIDMAARAVLRAKRSWVRLHKEMSRKTPRRRALGPPVGTPQTGRGARAGAPAGGGAETREATPVDDAVPSMQERGGAARPLLGRGGEVSASTPRNPSHRRPRRALRAIGRSRWVCMRVRTPARAKADSLKRRKRSKRRARKAGRGGKTESGRAEGRSAGRSR